MRKFYINAFFFALALAAVLVLVDFLSMVGTTRTLLAKLTDSTAYISEDTGSDEIKPYIKKARSADKTTKLIIGDSVCHQLFSKLQKLNPDIAIIGSNGGITVAGQYILAKEYLDAHPDASDVFLLMLPKSMARTFSTDWGYQYVVIPFSETDTLKYLDQKTLDDLGNVYGEPFLNPTVVRMIDRSGINRKLYMNLLKDHSEGYKQSYYFELADQYVCKIYEMCKEKNVAFHLYPCPVSEAKAGDIEQLEEIFEKSKIYEINPDYLNMITYFPAVQSEDDTHFSGKYASQKNYNEQIRNIYKDCELLDMIKLEP